MRSLSLFASTAVLAAFIAGTSHAAESAAPVVTIEELVVTAEKREQNLQDVPVAISAFTSKQRDLVGINTIQDYTNFTPGFVYNSYNDRASVRGIGRLTNIHAADSAVAIYIDGLFTTSTVLAGAPPIQVDRVEILRGPQGTLYGRNSIGGTVNILLARPTDHPYAEVRAIAENYGYTDFQAAASFPLAEGLAIRFDGYKRDQRDGYFTNTVPGKPSEGGVRNEFQYGVSLTAKLGEKVDTYFHYYTLDWLNRGGPGARSGYSPDPYESGLLDPNFPVIYNPAFGLTNQIVPGSLVQFDGNTTTTNPGQTDPRRFTANQSLKNTLHDTHSFTANITYHADKFDIKYIGGLQNYKYDLRGDTDATAVKSFQIPLAPGSICGTVHTLFSVGVSTQDCAPRTVDANSTYHYFEYPTWYSHEVNIASTGNGPLQWIAGLFYYHEDYSASGSTAQFYNPTDVALQHPVLGAAPNPTGSWSVGNYALTTESKAAFTQLDWQATPTLKFTLGLRYTEDHKSGYENRRVVCDSDACFKGLYANPALGLAAFGPGTAANWGSLLGNFAALPAVGKAIGLGNALAPFGGLGNGAFDITSPAAGVIPTTPGNSATVGAKGVSDPITCAGGFCTQGAIDPATGLWVRHLSDTSTATTGTLGVQWDPSEGTMLYARYSRGYKAFGFAAGSMLQTPESKPEFVNAYEVGVKKNFGRTLQVNGAIFYLDYIDMQAPVGVITPSGTVTSFVNVAKARSSGLEMDAIWQPTSALRFMLDYSYNPTRIEKSDKFVDANDNVTKTAVSVVGNKLPNAPENKVAINGNYSFFMADGTLTLGATYVWRDEAWSNIFTREYNKAPSWDQVDLRATYTPKDGKWMAIGYVKNVGDTLGYDAATTGSQRNLLGTAARNLDLNPPRTYGIELHYKFF